MKTAHLRNAGISVCVLTLITTVFLVSGSAQAEADVKFKDAASYYKDAKCVVCHGKTAEKKFNTEMKEEDLVAIILKGKKGEKPPNMPGYEAKGISADQAKELLAYMKSLKK